MSTLIELRSISKSYQGLRANDQISMSIQNQSIHALLGENGSGKSTLISVICGLTKHDSGEIYWRGEKISIDSPCQARELGICLVFQHFSLLNRFSVLENIVLSLNTKESLTVVKKRLIDKAREYKLLINPDAKIEHLSSGEKQRVEIIRCLLQNPKLLILDEPTSVLTPIECEHLFQLLNKIRDEGCSILFIGHKLNEIQKLCDSATILRQGRCVHECNPKKLSMLELARLMAGKEVCLLIEKKESIVGKPILEFEYEGTKTPPLFSKATVTLAPGKISGIVGIAGNGQETLMSLLAGEDCNPTAKTLFEGKNINHWGIAKRNKAGIFFVPTDRLNHSVVSEMSLSENALLGMCEVKTQSVKKGLLSTRTLKNICQKIINQFAVKGHVQQLAMSLSGGNLQKFIIGKSILHRPKILLLSNPTWGVDIQSATDIRRRLAELSHQGAAILIASEDLDEVFSLCDEISVMKRGELSPSHSTEQLTMEKVGLMMIST